MATGTDTRGYQARLTEENERLALQWAGPFGYAVLRILRQGDAYSEADFQSLVAQGVQEWQRQGVGLPMSGRGLLPTAQAAPPPPSPSTAIVAGHQGSGEPPPPAEFYTRVRKPGNRDSRGAVNGSRRDSMGRTVRPVR